MTRFENLKNSIIFGAVGDCIGSRYENSQYPDVQKSKFPDILIITDDTQLTLATVKAIARSRSIDPEEIANQFLNEYKNNRIRGIGASTLYSMQSLENGIPWMMAGKKGERASGNGAAMRIIPLIEFLDPTQITAKRIIRDVSYITHRDDEAYLGARWLLIVAKFLKEGITPEKSIKDASDFIPESFIKSAITEVIQSHKQMEWESLSLNLKSPGYIVDSVKVLTFAILKLNLCDPFETMLKIIDLGGDTDTNASMFGHIIGYSMGISSIPEKLLFLDDLMSLINPYFDELNQAF